MVIGLEARPTQWRDHSMAVRASVAVVVMVSLVALAFNGPTDREHGACQEAGACDRHHAHYGESCTGDSKQDCQGLVGFYPIHECLFRGLLNHSFT